MDKDKANRTELFETAKKWIDKGIEKVNPGREWVYCQAPHRIVIEKYIESESPDGLVDWKFFCFNGKVEFVYWLGNRVMGKSVQCGIFDSSFFPMNVYRTDEERLMHEVEKPDNFDDMVKIAEMLAKQFPHVRVDLYNEQNRIVFGELTFFPGSGYMKFVPDEFDIMIGKKFVLPKPRFYTNMSVSNSKRKTLGIIGGMGPMATADIFMKIISLTDASNDAEHIHIIIDDYPQIPDRTEAIRDGNKTPVLYIQDSIKRLEKAGADVLIMPCCTAHYFYNELSRKCSVALINMVAITAKVLNDRNIKRAGLLATNGTIESNVFEKEFLKYNINLIKPSEKGQKAIMNVIYDQIKSGKSICLDGILEEMEQMQKKGIEVFILGCTELPLAFANISCKYMLVDPTDILAIEAIKSVGYRVKKQDVLLTNNIFLSV